MSDLDHLYVVVPTFEMKSAGMIPATTKSATDLEDMILVSPD